MSLFGRGTPDCVIVPPRRAFAGAGCYGCAGMGGKPAKPSPSATAQRVLLPIILFALAACATPAAPVVLSPTSVSARAASPPPGGRGPPNQNKPLYPGPQSNVASLSEVI